MPPDSADERPRYEIYLTEPAEVEVERAYFGRMHFGKEAAERWYAGLTRSLESLSQFPNGFPIAAESTALGGGVRQMIYGKGRNAYRILYRVIEPEGENDGLVRVLHVRHAMQQLRPADEE